MEKGLSDKVTVWGVQCPKTVFRHWTFRKMGMKEASLKQHTLMTFIPKALGSTRLLHLSFSKAKFFRLNSQEPRPRLFRTHVRPTAGFWTECTTMLFCSMLKASKGYRLYLCHLMPHVNLKSSKLIWKLVCVYIRSAVGSSWKSRDMQLSYRCGQRMVKIGWWSINRWCLQRARRTASSSSSAKVFASLSLWSKRHMNRNLIV